MKTFYIHIGVNKTGTTAFQSILKENQTKLSKVDDIKYLEIYKLPFIREIKVAEHAKKELVEQFRDYIYKEVDHHSKYLISLEGFSGGAHKSIYSNTGIIARILGEVFKSFNVKILVVIRRQDELIQSVYTQRIQMGFSLNIDSFMRDIRLDSLNWETFLNPWIDIFGYENVLVFPYDREVLERLQIHQLLNTAIQSKVIGSVKKSSIKNVGFSENGILIAYSLMPLLNPSEQKILRKALQEVTNKGHLKEFNMLSKDSKQSLLSRFETSNRIVAKRYFYDSFQISNFSPPIYENAKLEPLVSDYQKLIIWFLRDFNSNPTSDTSFISLLKLIIKKLFRFIR